jgi:mediator of RNA polymerase II transcription subunit 14
LDFRVLKEGRVSIVDASHEMFDHTTSTAKAFYDMFGLEPIPDFSKIVVDVMLDLRDRTGLGRIALVDVGVICPSSAVTVVGRAIHSRIVGRLKGD